MSNEKSQENIEPIASNQATAMCAIETQLITSMTVSDDSVLLSNQSTNSLIQLVCKHNLIITFVL